MQSSITDVRSCRGLHVDFDHFMVMATIRLKIKRTRKSAGTRRKWDTSKLNIKDTRCNYEKRVQSKVILEEGDDIEMKLSRIKYCFAEVAREILGEEKTRKLNEWYNDECKALAQKRNKRKLSWLNNVGEEDKEEYEVI